MNTLLTKVIVVSAAILIGLGSYVLTRNPDGPIEQAAESVLITQGIDVDLSPED